MCVKRDGGSPIHTQLCLTVRAERKVLGRFVTEGADAAQVHRSPAAERHTHLLGAGGQGSRRWPGPMCRSAPRTRRHPSCTAHTREHAHARMHSHTFKQAYIHKHTHSQVHSQPLAHIRTCATETRAHTYARQHYRHLPSFCSSSRGDRSLLLVRNRNRFFSCSKNFTTCGRG